MSNSTVQARVTSALKSDADYIFASMGLSISDAIRIFLQQSVNVGGLPFQPRAKYPNRATEEAMQELKDNGGKRFNSSDELFAELGI